MWGYTYRFHRREWPEVWRNTWQFQRDLIERQWLGRGHRTICNQIVVEVCEWCISRNAFGEDFSGGAGDPWWEDGRDAVVGNGGDE